MSSQDIAQGRICNSYYQVTVTANRGGAIYDNDIDCKTFLSLLEKYLFNNDSVQVLAYCLTPNRFNLLMNQVDDGGVDKFVHKIVSLYDHYYFDEHGFAGILSFGEDYEISAVKPDDLLNASRCVHVAADNWSDYPLSSIRAYLYDDKPTWLDKTYIADVYGSAAKYLKFLQS